jgi:uncharacterized membrane protein (UPF0136 family)
MGISIFYYVFGAIAFLGGIFGFVRAGSRASLIAGTVSAALLIVAAILTPSGLAYVLALLISLILLAHFGRSYLAKRKPMPALPMIVLSIISVLWTIAAWLR